MRLFRLLVALLTSLALTVTNVAAIAGTHCIDVQTEGVSAAAGMHGAHHGDGAHAEHRLPAASATDDGGGPAKSPGTSVAGCSHCAYCQSCVSPLSGALDADGASSSPSSIVKRVADDRVSASDPNRLFRPPRLQAA